MKPLDTDKTTQKTAQAPAEAVPTAAAAEENPDFSNVKIEPLFSDFVDFDTFAKVKEASEVHFERRNRPQTHHFKRYPRVLRAGRAGGKDSDCDCKPATEKDDGH